MLLVIKTVANLQRQSEEQTVETTQSQIADMDIAETADGCGEVWVPVTRTQNRIMITREEHEVPRGQQGSTYDRSDRVMQVFISRPVTARGS